MKDSAVGVYRLEIQSECICGSMLTGYPERGKIAGIGLTYRSCASPLARLNAER